jgi:hypothetical protein
MFIILNKVYEVGIEIPIHDAVFCEIEQFFEKRNVGQLVEKCAIKKPTYSRLFHKSID